MCLEPCQTSMFDFFCENSQRFNRSLFQKQPPGVFCKKGVVRNFAKFTGKHLCQSLFLNKVAAYFI